MEEGLTLMSGQHDNPAIPPELEAAFEQNAQLRDALLASDMPLRFQAMVLGLATLKQSNPESRNQSSDQLR